jgi:hypothetical protein
MSRVATTDLGKVDNVPWTERAAFRRRSADEPARVVDRHHPGLRPVTALLHGSLDLEEEMRKNFSRVQGCRRFFRPL